MSTLCIRPAVAEDLEQLARNHREMALETEGRALDRSVTRLGTRAVFDDPSKGFYLVAERDGAFAGQLLVTYEWSDWRNGNFWWIQSVYVIPEARRSGVYRALHAEVFDMAHKKSDVCGVRLYVDRDNERAQATYRAMGMAAAKYDFYEVDFVLGAHR